MATLQLKHKVMLLVDVLLGLLKPLIWVSRPFLRSGVSTLYFIGQESWQGLVKKHIDN
jgi:hypothetical protein